MVHMPRKLMTLCLVYEHPRILLGMKKRGFGEGRWNGFGGKVHENESIENAARRELFEEAGIHAGELQQVGRLDFIFAGKPDVLEVNFFRVMTWTGEPQESEEMRPQWFAMDEIPFANMWPDDVHWMPLFFLGKKFLGTVTYDASGESITKNMIKTVDLLE
jgi:8-oxo-dGTP diphosphatase/2-hydroxy-dATP diphosphatase